MKKWLAMLLCFALLALAMVAQGEEEIWIEPFEEPLQESETDLLIDTQEADPFIEEIGSEAFIEGIEDGSDISDVEDETYVAESEGEPISNASETVFYYEDCVYRAKTMFWLNKEPYESASHGRWLNKGDTIRVVAVILNKYNNMWLKTDTGEYAYGGYRWDGSKWVKDNDKYVEFVSKNTNVSWSDNNIGGKVITYGQPYALSGTIRSSFTMYKIIGALYDGDTWKSTSGEINVSTTAYSVYGSALDMNLKFGSLPYSDKLNLRVLVQYLYDRGQRGDNYTIVLNFSNRDGVDRTPPTISGVSISNISSSGYTVSCNVSDNRGISHVAFPTWTVRNDQDDLFSDWWNTARGSISNGVATYRVNTSEHNNETDCEYITHIYAYDTSGNWSSVTAGSIYVPPKTISVTGVSLNKTSLSMKKEESYTLTATVSPSNATNKSVTWTSSNTAVATVNDGTVKAVGAGSATITAKTNDGGKTATCAVTVQNPNVPVTGVSINPTKLTMKLNETKLISATVYPSNATNKSVRYASSNSKVVMVNSNGLLAAVGAGTATITVSTVDGGYTAALKVTVEVIKPKKVKLNLSGTVKLYKGDTVQLTATLTPANAYNKLTWSSSKKSVASVDQNGKVTAKKKGTATITVKTSNGKKAKVKIKVK